MFYNRFIYTHAQTQSHAGGRGCFLFVHKRELKVIELFSEIIYANALHRFV